MFFNKSKLFLNIKKILFFLKDLILKLRMDKNKINWYSELFQEIDKYQKLGIKQLFIDWFSGKFDDVVFWKLFRALYEELEYVYPLMDIQDIIYNAYTPEALYETMFDDEHEVLNSLRNHQLSKVITIYRGQVEGDINGFSWTIDKKLAKWFSKRLGSKNPIVYRATIPTEELYCFWNSRKEKEVFIPPKLLKAVAFEISKENLND